MENTDKEKEGTERRRQAYEPPAVVSEEVFETLALSCGKDSGPICNLNGGFQS